MARSGHREMAYTRDAARYGAVVDLSCPPPTPGEARMPLITVRLIETVFSAEQKQQTARDLTKAMVAIEGERHARRHVLCHR
jgi:hypothetical protein